MQPHFPLKRNNIMALFFYQAFAKDGKKTTGFIDAPSVTAAREQLSRNSLFPTKVEAATEDSKQPWWQRIFARTFLQKKKFYLLSSLPFFYVQAYNSPRT